MIAVKQIPCLAGKLPDLAVHPFPPRPPLEGEGRKFLLRKGES